MYFDSRVASGTAGIIAASQLQGPQIDSELGLLSAWSFACSLCLHWFSMGSQAGK